jgi:hypothetical protein
MEECDSNMEEEGIDAYPQYFEKKAPSAYNPMFEAKAAVLMKMLEMMK